MATTKEVAEFLMLTLSLLGAISCLSRTDCNFPVFAYLWWIFFHVPEDKKRHQRCMISFVFLLIIQDLLFVLYWPIKWFSYDWLSISSETEGLHAMVTVFALIEIILKVLLLSILLVPDIGLNTPEALKLWWRQLGAGGHGQNSRVGAIEQLRSQRLTLASPRVPPASAGNCIPRGIVSSSLIPPS